MYHDGLKVRNRIRKPCTTDSGHGLPLFYNLVRSFIPTSINQLWVSDITYIPVWTDETTYEFVYLSLLTHAYSHEIIGWAVGPTLETLYPAKALDIAFRRLEGVDGETVMKLIHHSDRGVQYASRDYVKLLEGMETRISMTESRNPRD